jgi:hypothetical protein
MKMRLINIFILVVILVLIPGNALAQDYSYQVPGYVAHAIWNDDGTLSIDYTFEFANDPWGHPIEFVDLGLPTSNFDVNSITAEIDGFPVEYISASEFEGEGSYGVAISLGQHSIPPSGTGTVHVFIGTIREVLYPDDDDDSYVSAVLRPAYFTPATCSGNTDHTMIYHFPPAVQPEEPRWHSSPSGFSSEPEAGYDQAGRIFYEWRNPNANCYTQYEFGASFPMEYIPEDTIVTSTINPFGWIAGLISSGSFFPCACFAFFFIMVAWGVFSSRKRKLQYLPPKVSIEGHGIKRGLTAVEAAILLEQPLDKILTMILFGVIKKEAAEVVKRDPLKLKIIDPLPEGLHAYETDFLKAFEKSGKGRRSAMQTAVINLVKSVSKKMKGFSRKETIAYYEDITKRAWVQVETADTPEVKSQLYDEYMEWTMLDRDYDDRTRDVFRHVPVFIPMWWGRYDPSIGRTAAPRTSGIPSAPSSGGQVSLPTLPGSAFAASIVGGVQDFSSNVVGNINDFTGRITQQTNPAPKSSSSGGLGRSSGGGGCACACACAGCACACAGGGR